MNNEPRFSLRDGADLAGIELTELWWRYIALGGTGDRASLANQTLDEVPHEPSEHDLIAQALNEAFLDQGIDTFPVAYARDLPTPVARPDRARRDAVAARSRSRSAARRAAALHATAAQLMAASGQLRFARSAGRRAHSARQRGTVPAA